MDRPDLVARYLRFLDLEPDPALDLGGLGALIARHVARIPFSSVGPRLGEALPLDPESLFDRMVVRRRGGYCFEQNGLFFEVLEELGYSVTLTLARVIHDQDTHPGLTHRFTMVDLDGRRYVADVGFGSLGPRVPVLFSDQETRDGGRRFRVAERGPGEYHLQVFKDGAFFSLYRFDLVRYGPADCELGHFWSHRHPTATFVNHLVASCLLPDEARSLRDRSLRVTRTLAGPPESTASDLGAELLIREETIGDAARLRGVLADEFGILVDERESLRLFEGGA